MCTNFHHNWGHFVSFHSTSVSLCHKIMVVAITKGYLIIAILHN